MVVYFLPSFVLQIVSVSCCLYLTLEIRPTFKRILSHMIIVIIPVIYLYSNCSSLVAVVYCIILFLFFFYFDSIWSSHFALLYLIIFLIFFFFINRKDSRSFLDVSILTIASMVALNLAELFLFSFFIKLDRTSLSVSTVVYFIFFSILVCLYKLFIRKIWRTFFTTIVTRFILIITAIVTVGVLFVNLFIIVKQNYIPIVLFNIIIEAIFFTIIFVMSLLLFRIVKKENRLKQKEAEHQHLADYMESLERINQDMQKFRHDYQNILITMQGYIDTNDIHGLKTYFNDRIVKVEEQTLRNNYLYNQLDKLQLIELKGLIATKILLANEYHIELNIEVPEVIWKIDMDMLDLTRMIGILLDNAIEASMEIGRAH